VLHPNTRSFNTVFTAANAALKETFGMVMTELPTKEKHTVAAKRAAQRSGTQSQGASSSKAYVLTSTLPSSLRRMPVLAPARIPSHDAEAAYTGLYSFVIGVIMLSVSQRISDGKLMRYLAKVNADEMALEGTKIEEVLKRMEKNGYIVKIREREGVGGEETIDWVVGPRGKLEVGEKGVAGMVKGVYGKTGIEMEELEEKLERSLGKGTFKRQTARGEGGLGNGEAVGEGTGDAEEDAGGTSPAESGRAARPAPAYRGTARQGNGAASRQQIRGPAVAARGRPSIRLNGLIDEEADGEEDGEEGEEEDDDEDEEEEEEEEDDE
jgi:hypothetical protein